jgi:hypothetical protein
MTDDEILELASDANSNSADVWVMTPKDMIDFARGIAAKERETCAAPDLLNACQFAVMALAAAAERDPSFQRDYERASAAIAKANGESDD